jgi:hypothetical protein
MPNAKRLSRWQLIVWVLLLASAGATFLVLYPERRHGPFWEKYQQVRLGMTEQEVFDILGPPKEDWYQGGFGTHDCLWEEGEESIAVSFSTLYPHDGTAVRKQFTPKSTLEKVQDWWEAIR